jgi:hypothetical protein
VVFVVDEVGELVLAAGPAAHAVNITAKTHPVAPTQHARRANSISPTLPMSASTSLSQPVVWGSPWCLWIAPGGELGQPATPSFQRRMVESLLECDGSISVPKSWR